MVQSETSPEREPALPRLTAVADIGHAVMSESGRHWVCGMYFRLDGMAYPSHRWNDFADVLLPWWLAECSQKKRTYRFRFMDGPYEMTVTDLGGGRMEACFDGQTAACSGQRLMGSIVDAAKRLLEQYETTGFDEEAAVALRRAIRNVE